MSGHLANTKNETTTVRPPPNLKKNIIFVSALMTVSERLVSAVCFDLVLLNEFIKYKDARRGLKKIIISVDFGEVTRVPSFQHFQQRCCQSRSRIRSDGDGPFRRQLPRDNNANYSWSRWAPMRYLKKTSIPFTCRPFLESQYSVVANTHVETSLGSPCDTTSLTGLTNVFPFSSHSRWEKKKRWNV